MKTLRFGLIVFGTMLVGGALLAAFSPGEAHAQAVVSSGGSDACTNQACTVTSLTASSNGAGITSPKFTSSASSLATAIAIPTNTFLDFSGGATTARIYWSTSDSKMHNDNTFAATILEGQVLYASAQALGTCNSSSEGWIRRKTGSGGTNTSLRTQICVCTSDGAASPAYAWQNLVSGTVGTSTTCSP